MIHLMDPPIYFNHHILYYKKKQKYKNLNLYLKKTDLLLPVRPHLNHAKN
jgi:hypothetical protein